MTDPRVEALKKWAAENNELVSAEFAILLAAADAAANLPTHRHRKGGEYVLIGYGEHTETGEELAIYRSAKTGRLWCRPRAMFEDGRFTPIAPPPSPAVPLDGEGEQEGCAR